MNEAIKLYLRKCRIQWFWNLRYQDISRICICFFDFDFLWNCNTHCSTLLQQHEQSDNLGGVEHIVSLTKLSSHLFESEVIT